jgi:hypothetical protein
MRRFSLTPRFVEFIPETLEEGVLYVSMEYMTVAHKCCCGCGNEVSLPLSPTDWRLIFDGKTISLEPSIGNWSLPCKSHYWITRSQVRWARQWSPEEIAAGRAYDRQARSHYYGTAVPSKAASPSQPSRKPSGLVAWLKSWWS